MRIKQLNWPFAPILAFHRVGARGKDEVDRKWCVSVKRFSTQMRLLSCMGYRCTSLLGYLKQGNESNGEVQRSAVLTFDDAYEDVYREALPVLLGRGWSCTLFAVSDRIGQTNRWDAAKGWPERRLMSGIQLMESACIGIEIGGHSEGHEDLTTLRGSQLQSNVERCRVRLHEEVQQDICSFAYPFGRVNQEVRQAVYMAGYSAAVSVSHGFFTAQSDMWLLPRITIFEEHDTFRMMRVMVSYRRKALGMLGL